MMDMKTAGGAYGLSGEVIDVTGAAKGIGAGIALDLAEAGATVIVADSDAAGPAEQTERLRLDGFSADHVVVDLRSEESIVRAWLDVGERHGSAWGLVNKAGVQDRQLLLEGPRRSGTAPMR